MNNIISELTEQERQTIFECLCAAEQEEFFPEWEFCTLFGITRTQLSCIRKKWPEIDTSQWETGTALVGALNHLLYYPHGQHQHWDKYISAPPSSVQLILQKLLSHGL